MNDFVPTYYDEDEDREVRYNPDMPWIMRDQCARRAEDTAVVVLYDIADVMEAAPAGMFTAEQIAEARQTAEDADAAVSAFHDTYDNEAWPEWVYDASFDAPEGVVVDWDGDSSTVTTTLTAGWG